MTEQRCELPGRCGGGSTAGSRSTRGGGASDRKCSSRSTPVVFLRSASMLRDWVGMVMPCPAANASARSSGVKYFRARWYTLLGGRLEAEDEHHVGQVDGLAPRTGPHRGESRVDEHDRTVLDEHVGGLDVAVGQAGIPHLADDRERVVDDLVGHLGIAHFAGAFDELGDDHVLPLRSDLDEAVGLG